MRQTIRFIWFLALFLAIPCRSVVAQPSVHISSPSASCANYVYTFEIEFDEEKMAETMDQPFEYRWFFSADSIKWDSIPNSNVRDFKISKLTPDNVGWYRVAIAGAGNIDCNTCQIVSDPFKLEISSDIDILVNKYDWMLLVNNALVQKLFPDSVITKYEWYKDGILVEDATEDDYSSDDGPLEGSFQVFLTFEGGTVTCSNTVEFKKPDEPPMTMISVYNSTGLLVRQWQTMNEHEQYALPKGIYLLRIERGKEVKTGKLCIP